MHGLRVAADIGGTFTDIALIHPDGRLATRKVPSTPDDYARGVVGGLLQLIETEALQPEEVGEVLHACTVATNAILEGKGARTALITTEGFRDVLELRRIRVPRLYEPLYVKPPVLVPRRLRFEVRERLDARGRVLVPLETASLDAVIERLKSERIEAIAVCCLHSYANPEHERMIGERIRRELPEVFLSLSVDVLPEIREYERTSTTVINSLVGPPVKAYLRSLVEGLSSRRLPRRVLMMQSSGGIVEAQTVMAKPAQIVECGPAAGVIGARHLGALAGYPNLISFDMGGTTAKASLIERGELTRTDEYEVGGGVSLASRLVKGGGYALKLPVIDIAEVGAGGGSVVWLDRAGSLKVGPHSAGAVPGPVCYGRGGSAPTVTDANVVLGYLNAHALAGGTVPIDGRLSEQSIESKLAQPLGLALLDTAYGIYEIVTTIMTRAVKTVSTYRGRDPRAFTLLAFGGNGGIHAPALARELGITRVIVPPGAGVLSALGLLFADVATSASAAFLSALLDADAAALEAKFAQLQASAIAELGRAPERVTVSRSIDLRYRGQAFELTLPFHSQLAHSGAAFEAEHERTYGHRLNGKPIEVVTLRVTVAERRGPPRLSLPKEAKPSTRMPDRRAFFGRDAGFATVALIDRSMLDATPRAGPFIIEEYEGTTVVPPGARASRDPHANIVIEIPAE